jgi:hypothetical protein
MDDNSNGVPVTAQVALNGITSIAAGESVIFQETATPPTAKSAFVAAWFGGTAPAGLQIGSYTGSGVGLSSAADAVNLFNASGVLQPNVSFGASTPVASLASFDTAAGLNNAAISQLSLAGTNGGTGDPDSEGVTYAGNSSANGIFVSTERNNSNSGVSKLSILRFDPNVAGTSLNANMEFDLTADLPPTGANLGMEAITWVPDSYLTANNFFDEHTNAVYNPANYVNHTTGLFFIGIEGTGNIYAYALDQVSGGFTKIATIPAVHTPAAIMNLQFDRDLNELWAVCDNTCAGRHALLRLDPATGMRARWLCGQPNDTIPPAKATNATPMLFES